MRTLVHLVRPDYCEMRAIEFITEAQLSVEQPEHYQQCLIRGIRLLLLAMRERAKG